jgi:DNA topoisomerase VI subunit B
VVAPPSTEASVATEGKPKTEKKKGARTYFRITCLDNGCGMPHDKIPDMFGRVLSGSKYGVRQTRLGKPSSTPCFLLLWWS